MRTVLSLLVFFGLMIGVHQAAVPGHTGDLFDAAHLACDAASSHDADDSHPPCDSPLGQKCDHHVHACCLAIPMANPAEVRAQWVFPASVFSRLLEDRLLPPDEPCLSDEKPPLI